jgi:phage shock protein C
VSNRLYRSPTDKVIGGVAGGLAVWMNVDPSLVRIAWVLLAIFSGGIFVLVYFVMMLIVPLPPAGWTPPPPGMPRDGAVPGWDPGTGSWAGTAQPPGAAPGGVPPAPGAAGWGAAGTTPGAAPGWSDAPGTAPAGQPTSWATPPASSGPSRVNAENAGIVFGAVLILLGAWFLVDQYVDIDWSLLWPVVVIVLGVGLIVVAVGRSRSTG